MYYNHVYIVVSVLTISYTLDIHSYIASSCISTDCSNM